MKTIKMKKDGNWLDFTVIGYSEDEKREIAAELNIKDANLAKFIKMESGSILCKKDQSTINRVVEKFTAKEEAPKSEAPVTAKPVATKKPRRWVASKHYVELNGITNHGKFWRASLNDVDTGKVPAGLEGEMVCYVYE